MAYKALSQNEKMVAWPPGVQMNISQKGHWDVQGFSWTEIYFGHFVQAAPILFGHLEIF